MTNPQLSERLKSLMWDLGPDRYIVMRELILEAQRLERMQPDSLRAVEPAGNAGDFEYAFEQRRRKMADWWDLTEEQRKFYRNGFEEGFWSGIATEPPAQCTCQPLAQQLGVPFGLTAVAVDPECPVHREPSADARDAARYRYLRDDHAYEPEEQAVRGGSDLDALCDAGNAENRSVTTKEG